MDSIKHVVLLMLENHSFDQMLGAFKVVYPGLEGIDPNAPPKVNMDRGGKTFAQTPTTARNMSLDPMHEVEHVSKQIAQGRNSGFVLDLEDQYDAAATDILKHQIMAYYPLDYLPALHPLAHDFMICDHWFSSLPGPTWPNRFFALSGTSCGATAMPENIHDPDLEGFFEQTQDTIFDRLSEANISWNIFVHDFPLSLFLTHQHRFKKSDHYQKFSDFLARATGPESGFPQFAFIEPRYSGEDQNDDHPPHDIMRAQQLIADVYNAIRANVPLWNSTLLVINYDEHGGFYDHVPPPRAVSPDKATRWYAFNQYGIRVPALLISPWVQRGFTNTVFDHTSLLRYLSDKWSLRPLGRRVAQANSIAESFGIIEKPRKDTVAKVSLSPELKRPSTQDLLQYESANHRAISAFFNQLAIEGDLVAPSAIGTLATAAQALKRIVPGLG